MPELPEVETTVRDLRPHLVGRTFTGVEALVPRMVRTPSPEAFAAGLAGRTAQTLDRRGKFIVARLDRGALVAHLMMGGSFRWAAPGSGEPVRFTCFRFHLDDRSELWLVNPRTLGGVWLVDDASEVVGHLGPEPLDDDFILEVLKRQLAGRTAPIKPLLLDQSIVAGVGNIYADESLFLAGIRPERPADELTDAELARLHAAIRESLDKGVRLRGTSFDDYLNPDGSKGEHQEHTNVFRREGKPCPTCGTPIQKKTFRGRGTHYCAQCQR
ncbi:MAG: bifunctional DNA-formamidopyrimidine glycosylase/DNA-(apurinic or apyrimidinic site) lyase [Chloroflexota bacterium]